MTASTVTLSIAAVDLTDRLLKRAAIKRSVAAFIPQGGFIVDSGSQTIPTTSSDEINDRTSFFKFGPNTYGLGYTIVFSDMDTAGSPTLVFALEKDDGTTQTNIATSLTGGQTGATNSGSLGAVDISNCTINLKVTTAGTTPAAGTARIYLHIHVADPKSITF